MNKAISMTSHVHRIISAHLRHGDIVIDATVGNGHDTLFLAQCVSEQGIVYGFDVQKTALVSTRSRLKNSQFNNCFELFHRCHSQLAASIPKHHQGKINAILFNLGYLPGGDKSIITQTASTLKALGQAIMLIATDGIITIVAYPGHPGGEHETRQIAQWCNELDKNILKVQHIKSSDKKIAPQLFVIKKVTTCQVSPRSYLV